MLQVDDSARRTVLINSPQALLHASLGTWLRAVAAQEAQQRRQQEGEDAETPSAAGLPAPLLWTGRMAVAFGSLVVVLLVRRYALKYIICPKYTLNPKS